MSQTILVEMNIASKYFDAIADGSKTVEGRLQDDKRRQLMDKLHNLRNTVSIRFICTETGQTMDCQLRGYRIYPSFVKAAEVSYKEMIPWADSPKEAADVYREFFTAEQEAKYGVVLLDI